MRPPSISKIIEKYGGDLPHKLAVFLARETAAEIQARAPKSNDSAYADELIAKYFLRGKKEFFADRSERAVNASGILLHSGLGRAPLPQLPTRLSESYQTIAVNKLSGRRKERDGYSAKLLKCLTGAEDAIVVNNNAAAALLVLHTFSKDKETVVSRGELIEIGGNFKIPEIMEASGAILKETGCTNKTSIEDFIKVSGTQTALYLKAAPSNYSISGFVSSASIKSLSAEAKKRGIITAYDMGSASLIDLSNFGIKGSNLPGTALKQGADLVFFSGDKLLGGVQAGIILGKKNLIAQMKQNPLYRALRVCKLTITYLENILEIFMEPESIQNKLPLYKMLSENEDALRKKAELLIDMISDAKTGKTFYYEPDWAYAGCGSAPEKRIPSIAVKSLFKNKADKFVAFLRDRETPIFARIKQGKVCFDMRTVSQDELKLIAQAIKDWDAENL